MITSSLAGLGAISHSGGLGAISHSGGLGAISHSAGGLGAITHSMGLLGLGESMMGSNLLKLAIGGGLLYMGYRFMQDRAEKREIEDRRLIQMRGALGRARRRRRHARPMMGLGYNRSGVSLVGTGLGRARRRRRRHARPMMGLGYGSRHARPMMGLGSAGLGFRGRPVARSRRAAMRMPYSF
jgi:hypothetical protein